MLRMSCVTFSYARNEWIYASPPFFLFLLLLLLSPPSGGRDQLLSSWLLLLLLLLHLAGQSVMMMTMAPLAGEFLFKHIWKKEKKKKQRWEREEREVTSELKVEEIDGTLCMQQQQPKHIIVVVLFGPRNFHPLALFGKLVSLI